MKSNTYVRIVSIASVFVTVILAGQAEAQIYHWVDDKGVANFSDRPLSNHDKPSQLSVSGPSPSMSVGSSVTTSVPESKTAPKSTQKKVRVPLASILTLRERDRLLKAGINPNQTIPLVIDAIY